MLKELLLKNRSYRRFVQNVRITREELAELVGLTRYCASGRNAQALKYKVVADADLCGKVFPNLAWAGYLKDWDGPEEGERPAAYLIQLLDTSIVENCLCDDGIQAQTILLGAVEKGYGGCIIKAFKNESLREVLQLPEHLQYKVTFSPHIGGTTYGVFQHMYRTIWSNISAVCHGQTPNHIVV